MDKKAAKYEQIKKALLALSFDWIEIRYTESYKSNEVYYRPDADILWTLNIVGNFLYLVHGDNRLNLGFINEYNTSDEFVMKQAEAIHKAAKEKC